MLKSVYFNSIETFFDEETIANFKNVTCQTVPLTQEFCVLCDSDFCEQYCSESLGWCFCPCYL